jgi:hypothetical protein
MVDAILASMERFAGRTEQADRITLLPLGRESTPAEEHDAPRRQEGEAR